MFKVGQRIKARDFKHVPQCYVTGRIKDIEETGSARAPFAHYVIECDSDFTVDGPELGEYTRVGETVLVPLNTMLDYPERITLLENT